MKDRLYYEDAYRTNFSANITERLMDKDGPAVILDQTCFYPTSGGQPHDLGLINQIQVLDVYIRQDDHKIVHLLANEVIDDSVEAEIDWIRRFDHMQQHTGQHILSQAFVRVADKETLSFHLGTESSTINLAGDGLTETFVNEAELLANQIIWENRPIKARMLSVEAAANLELRKIPELNSEKIRVVEIVGFDICACGGTHVSRTGEIGIVKIIKTERRGDEVRIEFLCGNRAFADYSKKNTVLNQLSNRLTTGYWELENVVQRMQEDAKVARKQLMSQTKRAISLEAESMFQAAVQRHSTWIITSVFQDRDPAELRMLANQIARHPKCVALLGSAGPKSHLVFAASKDMPVEMGKVMERILPLLGEATGGGSSSFSQGGGPSATKDTVHRALNEAQEFVDQSIPEIST